MARAKVVENDFPAFLELFRRCESSGAAIAKHQTEKWSAFIAEHGINESMAVQIAREQMESITLVIITEGSESDGLYLYSIPEEFCLRVVTI